MITTTEIWVMKFGLFILNTLSKVQQILSNESGFETRAFEADGLGLSTNSCGTLGKLPT